MLRLEERSLTSLLNLPPAGDSAALERAKTYEVVLSAAAAVDLNLHAHLSATLLELCLNMGMSPATVYAFGAASLVIAQTPLGNELSKMSLAAAIRFGDARHIVRVRMLRSLLVAHWHRPLSESITAADEAIAEGREANERHFATWAIVSSIFARLAAGTPLDALVAHTAAVAPTLKQNAPSLHPVALIADAFARRLRDGAQPNDLFDDVELRARLRASSSPMPWFAYLTRKLLVDHLEARTHEADVDLEELERIAPSVVNTVLLPDYHITAALVRGTQLRNDDNGTEAEVRRAEIERHLAHLKRWDKLSTNARHGVCIVSALLSMQDNQPEIAGLELDRAIGAAQTHRFPQYAAIASELAAGIARERGDLAQSTGYLENARANHRAWGALAQAERVVSSPRFLPQRRDPTTRSLLSSRQRRLRSI
jgi:hypothetical protein